MDYGINFDSHTLPTILCCLCGTPIPSNPSNMCVSCIRSQVDITEGIPKQLVVQWCKGCGKYLNPPATWVACDLESKELLALCLKRVKGMNTVRLVDAGFVWTEPHSMRLKIKLTIQKEVFTATILQQVFIIEYVVQPQQCDGCRKFEAKDTWNAVVQARQRVDHKKTFFHLEQLILKYNAHLQTLSVKETPDGLDFFFGHRSHAMKFVDFLQAMVPIRSKSSEKLISQDDHSNTYNYKYTFAVEITPICRDDVVCLPTKLANSCGNISPLLLCYKVTNSIHLIDPLNLQTTSLSASQFWTIPFRSICSAKQLIEYVVLDITPVGPVSGKFVLCDVQVARSADFGSNDTIFLGRTHLGHILKPGDLALGYDLSCANFNESDITSYKGRQFPDLFLVRKAYPEKRKKNRQRHWKLKSIDKEMLEDVKEMEKSGRDYEKYMQDLEEDPELRSQINIYKEKNAEHILSRNRQLAEEEMEGDELPDISLDELIEDLPKLSLEDH